MTSFVYGPKGVTSFAPRGFRVVGGNAYSVASLTQIGSDLTRRILPLTQQYIQE